MREEELADRLRRSDAVVASSVGSCMGDWRLTAFLAHGGNADVYCAEHVVLGTAAAVKVLRDEGRADRRERFRREARLLSELKSASFPRFFAYGASDGHDYLVEELLEPRVLPSGKQGVRFLLALCDAVGELHQRGIVHCDIKPANILFRPETGEPVLVDLGLAVSPSEDSRGGTLGYSAPEQFLGGVITPAADIHALGVLAERLNLGCRDIIRRATSSIPSERFGSVHEFVRALRRRVWMRKLAWVACGLLIAAVVFAWVSRTPGRPDLPPQADSVPRPGSAVQTSRDSMTELEEHLWPDQRKEFQPESSAEASGDLLLAGQTVVRSEPLRVAAGKTLRVIGPGTLDAVISGGEGSRLWMANCVVLNRSERIFPADPLRYELSGMVYLNFVNADKPEISKAEFDKYFNPYVQPGNEVRYHGPLTLSALARQRKFEYFQRKPLVGVRVGE